jgi:hypothetical protein
MSLTSCVKMVCPPVFPYKKYPGVSIAFQMAHLYVISRSDAPGLLKVGRSDNPERRALDLQAGHCFWIVVQAVVNGHGDCEREVHRLLQHVRMDGPGREWFRADLPGVLETIATAARSSRESQRVPMVVDDCNMDNAATLGFTNNVAEASSAAEVRRGISTTGGLSMSQVHAALVGDGLEECAQNYIVTTMSSQPVRSKKRVYKRGVDGMFAVLVQTPLDDQCCHNQLGISDCE